MRKYSWLRVLRQPDPWECMVAYIYSARSDTSTIGKNAEAIAKELGQPTRLDDCERHTFPTLEKVLAADVGPLMKVRVGGLVRAPSCIIAAAQRISDGRLDLCRLAKPQVRYDEAIWQLKKCYGVGHKIANCIALFSLDKMEAFPVDVHVCRAVASYFPSQTSPSDEAIVNWAHERFGKYAGYANQFLFYDEYQKPKRRAKSAAV